MRLLGPLMSLVLACAALAQLPHANATAPGANGAIVYSAVPAGESDTELFLQYPDGHTVRLTDNSGNDEDAEFSPDGTKVAWTTHQNGFAQVAVMGIDRTGLVLFAPHQSAVANLERAKPTWSPDGNRIAYQEQVASDGVHAVWSLGSSAPDGTSEQPLIAGSWRQPCGSPYDATYTCTREELDPSWSSSGIVYIGHYVRENASTFAVVQRANWIALLTPGATAPVSMVQSITEPLHVYHPAWSADGTQIVYEFWTSDDPGTSEIYRLSATARNVGVSSGVRLTTDSVWQGWPTWSPDGTRILFTRGLANTDQELVSVSSSDGSGAVEVTNDSVDDQMADWQAVRPTPPPTPPGSTSLSTQPATGGAGTAALLTALGPASFSKAKGAVTLSVTSAAAALTIRVSVAADGRSAASTSAISVPAGTSPIKVRVPRKVRALAAVPRARMTLTITATAGPGRVTRTARVRIR